MFECAGRFLGAQQSSTTKKDGSPFWTRTLDVNTRRGTETVHFTDDAWALLHGEVAKCVQYETELLLAVEPKISSEFGWAYGKEPTPTIEMRVIDFQILSGPGSADHKPKAGAAAANAS